MECVSTYSEVLRLARCFIPGDPDFVDLSELGEIFPHLVLIESSRNSADLTEC